jgi:hypothetical protein
MNSELVLGLGIFQKRTFQVFIYTHTVTYKSIAPADNPAQLEFKLVKTDGTDTKPAECNKVTTVNNLLHSLFSAGHSGRAV